MLIRLIAAAVFIAFLWSLFRFAMGLRYAKVLREEERRAEETAGRHVVAEVPNHAGEVVLLREDGERLLYGEREITKRDVLAARLVLNGRVVETRARPGVETSALPPPEEYDGRERWDVLLTLGDGGAFDIQCGTLREGISREIAERVFRCASACVEATGTTAPARTMATRTTSAR
jgi:hypothetical protein